MLPALVKEKFSIILSSTSESAVDELHTGYIRLDKLENPYPFIL